MTIIRMSAPKGRRVTVDGRAYLMTDDRVEAVVTALLRMSQDCDGARTRDYVGFNRHDSNNLDVRDLVDLAWEVAASDETMSDEMAARALPVLHKYRKTQLAYLRFLLFPKDKK